MVMKLHNGQIFQMEADPGYMSFSLSMNVDYSFVIIFGILCTLRKLIEINVRTRI